MGNERLNRDQLLATMQSNWQEFLPSIDNLSGTARISYLHAQGYNNLRDLLAHINQWWRETLRCVPILLKGGEPIYQWTDVDNFNAQAIKRYKHRGIKHTRGDFLSLQAKFSGLISKLPDDGLNNDRIYQWVINGVVDHYEEHKLPN